MVMASAVALPLQQLVLCSPLMFQYKESFFWGDGVALALVLSGFGVYHQCSREGRASRGVTNDSKESDVVARRSSRGPTLSARKRKKAELQAAQDDLRERRQSLRSGARNGAGGNRAKMRSLLRCDQCEHLDSGVCDTCRALFASDKWVEMDPEWRERRDRDAQSS